MEGWWAGRRALGRLPGRVLAGHGRRRWEVWLVCFQGSQLWEQSPILHPGFFVQAAAMRHGRAGLRDNGDLWAKLRAEGRTLSEVSVMASSERVLPAGFRRENVFPNKCNLLVKSWAARRAGGRWDGFLGMGPVPGLGRYSASSPRTS